MGGHTSTGQNHYRQRRILLPASSPSESKIQISMMFRECARKLTCPNLFLSIQSLPISLSLRVGVRVSPQLA